MTISGQHFYQRPHSASEFKANVYDFAGHETILPWIFNLLTFLDEHESECDPFYTDVNMGMFSWVKYHEAAYGTIPSNFVAVGDAVMKLNPGGGECLSLEERSREALSPTDIDVVR